MLFRSDMRMIYQPIFSRPVAILMALVFSLVLSGPAYAGMDCASHVMPSAAMTGTSSSGHSHSSHQMGQAGHHGNQAGQEDAHANHAQQAHKSAATAIPSLFMAFGECCLSADCLSEPTIASETRFNKGLDQLLITRPSLRAPVMKVSPLMAQELFARYWRQQGPPLQVATAYKAHRGITSRQII